MGTAPQTFGDKLGHALRQKQLGVRTLARKLGAGDVARSEVIRRRLNKYLHEGVTPTEPVRHEIEDALELDRDSLKADEEESLDADLLSVVRAIQILVRAEVARERSKTA